MRTAAKLVLVPNALRQGGDPIPPGALSGVSVTGGQLGHVDIAFTAPASLNVARVAIYRTAPGIALNRSANLVTKIPVVPNEIVAYVQGDDSVANLISNSSAATDTGFAKGTGWTHAAGKYTHAAGVASNLSWPISPTFAIGVSIRIWCTVSARAAGMLTQQLLNPNPVGAASLSGNGLLQNTIVTTGAHTHASFRGDAAFDGSADDFGMYQQTLNCAPAGMWDYHLEAENGSGVPGPTSVQSDKLIY